MLWGGSEGGEPSGGLGQGGGELDLMLRVTVVIMPDLDRVEVILMTMVVVMMVLDCVEVTKDLIGW